MAEREEQMKDLVAVEVKNNIGTIEDNLEAVGESIRKQCESYASVVVTEDTVKDGKKFLADVRKEQKALDDERKEIKKAWMKPYEEFEARAKKIIALYDEPIRLINGQLDEYEEQRKEAKRQVINDIYKEVVEEPDRQEFKDWLPLEKIYDKRWENATCTDKKIRESMEASFAQLNMSVGTIRSMQSEWEADALKVLRETGSLQMAVDKITQLTSQAKRIEERKMQQEEEKRKEEERKKAGEEKAAQEQAADVPKQKLPEQTADLPFGTAEIPVGELPFASEKMITLKVTVGEGILPEVREFLDERFITYEVI